MVTRGRSWLPRSNPTLNVGSCFGPDTDCVVTSNCDVIQGSHAILNMNFQTFPGLLSDVTSPISLIYPVHIQAL